MAPTGYERLSAQDSSFLQFEREGNPAHISAVAIFEPGSLGCASGGLDMERIRAHILARLDSLPHYRQHLAYTPVQRHPIWVDDAAFDLAHHVHHAGLPSPGSRTQLAELAGRITSQPLNMKRPLWELWFVEGLPEGRFAAVAKVHHCMVDGVSGVNVLTTLFSPQADPEVQKARRWKPKPAPDVLDFLIDGVEDNARLLVSALRATGEALQDPLRLAADVRETVVAGWETVSTALTPPAQVPINGRVGPKRRLAWRRLALVELVETQKRLDGSLNDVVLAVVGGAVRSLLQKRRLRLKGIDFRIVIPVDTRATRADMEVGNRVSSWFLSLPVAERSPLVRFEAIRRQTRRLKKSNAKAGIENLMRFADWSGSTRLGSWAVSLTSALKPYNLIVSNVHGPQVPLYLLDARLLEFYPHLPLFANQGLSVTVLSYLDAVYIGLTGDWDLLPDLDHFADALDTSFQELQEASRKRDRP